MFFPPLAAQRLHRSFLPSNRGETVRFPPGIAANQRAFPVETRDFRLPFPVETVDKTVGRFLWKRLAPSGAFPVETMHRRKGKGVRHGNHGLPAQPEGGR